MTNTETPDDVVELVDNEGGLGITYRIRQCACGEHRMLTTFVVVLLILIAAAVIGILCGLKKSTKSKAAGPEPVATAEPWTTTKPSTATTTTTTSTTPPLICNTTKCHNISQDISSQLDKSVDPCDDFYSYTCGGFFKRHKLKTNQSRVNAFTILNEDNLIVLQNALQNASSSYSKSSSIKKTTEIYNSCVNTTAINNRGIEPLVKLIEQYGGWTVTGNGTNSWTVEEKMGRILRDLNVKTLLSVSVETDFLDSSRHILKIHPSALGISPSYYVTYTSQSRQIQQAYKTYMKTIARLLGGGYDAEQRMMKIYNFERDLADAAEGSTYSDDLVESLQQYHRSGRSLDSLDSTIWEFCLDTDFTTSFILDFLNSAFSDQGITFNSAEKVFYGTKSIFQAIYSLYLRRDDDLIKDYMMWQVVSKYVSSMPDQFVQAKRKFAEAVVGVQEYKRWSSCIEAMMTPMDMALGRLFVDAHFDEATKTTVADMTIRLRKAFINNLDSADWMDYETKGEARKKANAIKEDVGYPPYIEDDSKLDAHYSMLTVNDNLFENTLAMSKMLIQRNFDMLRKPVNKDLWGMGPAQINGYYSPQQNRIVFLAGILQSPFYKKNYPKYLNYGSLAMVIGHEITHGFDGTGRLFDKNGNVKDWWSSSSELNFTKRARCLVDQYNDYEVFGEYINGKQTLDENIADNGGIKLAYDAYQSWVSDNEEETQLPGLGLSVDQLFFIGFAMPWCSVYNKEAALYQLKSDVHSYNKYRVIGPLSNFDKFAQAFSCSIGSSMNPYDKCTVW